MTGGPGYPGSGKELYRKAETWQQVTCDEFRLASFKVKKRFDALEPWKRAVQAYKATYKHPQSRGGVATKFLFILRPTSGPPLGCCGVSVLLQVLSADLGNYPLLSEPLPPLSEADLDAVKQFATSTSDAERRQSCGHKRKVPSGQVFAPAQDASSRAQARTLCFRYSGGWPDDAPAHAASSLGPREAGAALL